MYTIAMRNLIAAAAALALFGAGCQLTAPTATPQIAEQIGAALTERPIAQSKGFGAIPSVPTPQLKPGTTGTVRLNAALPTFPPTVAVLRVRSGNPDDAQILNIASSFGLPGGIVGSHPVGRGMTLDWTDGNGMLWSYDAAARSVEFADESSPTKALTVSEWTGQNGVLQKSVTFLDDRDISRQRLGLPFVDPDWSAWWDTEQSLGRCMDADTIAIVRAISSSPSYLQQPPPTLPLSKATKCVAPEFPSRMVVRMNETQDGQAIFLGDGTAQVGATLFVDATTGDVRSGSFAIRSEPDRSDYPAVTADDARKGMLSGGLGGTPNGDVAIDSITSEWYAIRDTADPTVSYYFPALIGSGTITFPDGRAAAYRIVVPLVKTD